jgi:hypothetical protein
VEKPSSGVLPSIALIWLLQTFPTFELGDAYKFEQNNIKPARPLGRPFNIQRFRTETRGKLIHQAGVVSPMLFYHCRFAGFLQWRWSVVAQQGAPDEAEFRNGFKILK